VAKIPTTFRLSDEAKDLLEGLGKKLGLSDTAVVEMAIRRLAEQENINREDKTMASMRTFTQGGFGVKGWETFLADWIKSHPEMMIADYYRQANPVFDKSVLEYSELDASMHNGSYEPMGIWSLMRIEDQEEIGYRFLEKITREKEFETGKPVDRSMLKRLFPDRY
jgi:predicted transcriptional regulator